MTDTQLRRLAAEFYLKPSGITGIVEDWIEGDKDTPTPGDSDIVDLFNLLRRVHAEALKGGGT